MKKIALEEALTAPGLEKYLEKTLALVPDAEKRAALTIPIGIAPSRISRCKTSPRPPKSSSAA